MRSPREAIVNPRLGYLALAAAVLALGLSAFALTRSPEPPRQDAESDAAPRSRAAELRELEARIAQLERSEDAPRLRSRLDDLDRRLSALNDEPIADAPIAREDDVDPVAAPPPESGEPDDDAIDRFERLQAASAHRKKVRQYTVRIGGALKKAGVELSAEESEKLVTTFIGFEERRRSVWEDVKRTNPPKEDWPRLIVQTSEMLNREFTERISTFLPGDSVPTVAQTLVPIRRGDGRR